MAQVLNWFVLSYWLVGQFTTTMGEAYHLVKIWNSRIRSLELSRIALLESMTSFIYNWHLDCRFQWWGGRVEFSELCYLIYSLIS